MSIQERVEDLNSMILEGRILDAFEKYYSDDIEMVEVDGTVRKGKESNREFEKAFVDGLVEFRGADLLGVAVDEEAGVAFVEWAMDYTHKEWGDRKYRQVSAQRWRDGQIHSERFYLN